MIYKKKITFIIIVAFISLFACNEKKNDRLIVLISKKQSKYTYTKWLKKIDNEVKLVYMYDMQKDSVEIYYKKASGFLLTGGEDVNSELYGKADKAGRCEGFNLKRDSVELDMIRYALKNKIPLLGICRGEQILNVSEGGTLIIDIPTDYGTTILHRKKKDTDKTPMHKVKLKKNSLLYKICGVDSGVVNSWHHQAVEKIAEGYNAVAFAPDSLIEAIELKDTTKHPFVLGVQWHPERLNIKNNLSGKIGKAFLKKCWEYQNKL